MTYRHVRMNRLERTLIWVMIVSGCGATFTLGYNFCLMMGWL